MRVKEGDDTKSLLRIIINLYSNTYLYYDYQLERKDTIEQLIEIIRILSGSIFVLKEGEGG